MLKRLSIALITLMGLVYVLSLFLSAYGLFISRGWWVVEPWLGERPEIVYHDTFSGSAWRVKADKARIQEIVQRLQAEPIEYPAYDYDEAFAQLCLDRLYSTAAYRTPHRCRLMTPNGWVLTEDSVCDIWELTDGYAFRTAKEVSLFAVNDHTLIYRRGYGMFLVNEHALGHFLALLFHAVYQHAHLMVLFGKVAVVYQQYAPDVFPSDELRGRAITGARSL